MDFNNLLGHVLIVNNHFKMNNKKGSINVNYSNNLKLYKSVINEIL